MVAVRVVPQTLGRPGAFPQRQRVQRRGGVVDIGWQARAARRALVSERRVHAVQQAGQHVRGHVRVDVRIGQCGQHPRAFEQGQRRGDRHAAVGGLHRLEVLHARVPTGAHTVVAQPDGGGGGGASDDPALDRRDEPRGPGVLADQLQRVQQLLRQRVALRRRAAQRVEQGGVRALRHGEGFRAPAFEVGVELGDQCGHDRLDGDGVRQRRRGSEPVRECPKAAFGRVTRPRMAAGAGALGEQRLGGAQRGHEVVVAGPAPAPVGALGVEQVPDPSVMPGQRRRVADDPAGLVDRRSEGSGRIVRHRGQQRPDRPVAVVEPGRGRCHTEQPPSTSTSRVSFVRAPT